MKPTQHTFAAETGRILELLTHSIYSNKEIFLRELISNASDAIDKARIKALTDTTFLGDDTEFQIKLTLDSDAKTLTISDNGIGMTESEIHSHLGTIAKSGTKEFLEKLQKAKQGGDHNLIGQFGVGFYSAFMVAKKVEVITRSGLDTKAHKWTSDGSSGYDLEETQKESRGTDVILHFSEGNHELLENWKIKELVKKYSNYVAVPVMMEEEITEEGKETKKEWKQLNETKALWKRDKKDISPEEYQDLYQSLSMDFKAPLGYTHNKVEGNVSFSSLLYIPQEVNMFADMRDPNKDYGPKLYVQNVLILEHAKELLPVWLRFVSGVIETTDLPLNISREMLQSNKALETIKKALVKKILGELKKLREEKTSAYQVFFENFGAILKEGIYYEHDLKESIAEVCLWESMQEGKKISFDQYLEVAKPHHHSSPLEKKEQAVESQDAASSLPLGENGEGDKTIYYITGKSRSEVLASPYLAQFTKNKVDVLLLTDTIDEWIIGVLSEYKSIKLLSVTSDAAKLTEITQEEKEEQKKQEKDYSDLLELIKNTIGSEKIEKVVLNSHLGDALGALKTPDGAMNPQMEKMMRAMGQVVPPTKRILELNPENKLLKAMKKEFSADIKSKKLKDLTSYAYMQAILLEGGELEDMGAFVKLTNSFAGEYLK